jgi:hypothetical protein
MLEELHRIAPAMLEEWDKTKRAPQHAAWLHDGSHDFNTEEKKQKAITKGNLE